MSLDLPKDLTSGLGDISSKLSPGLEQINSDMSTKLDSLASSMTSSNMESKLGDMVSQINTSMGSMTNNIGTMMNNSQSLMGDMMSNLGNAMNGLSNAAGQSLKSTIPQVDSIQKNFKQQVKLLADHYNINEIMTKAASALDDAGKTVESEMPDIQKKMDDLAKFDEQSSSMYSEIERLAS